MEVIIKEKTEKSLHLVFKDIDISFLNLICYELLKDKRILNAYAIKRHLLIDEIDFYVLSDGSVELIDFIKQKIEEIKNSFVELKEQVLKFIK